MSQGPSTLGIMTTSSLSPISPTSVVRSSRTHGDSRLLTLVHSAVSPKSISLPALTSPSRAASFLSTGTASSRLPSRMSTVGAMSGTFASIFSLEKSTKWIIRLGLNGISSTGSGAPIASGLAKSRGLRTGRSPVGRRRKLPRIESADSRLELDAQGVQGKRDHVVVADHHRYLGQLLLVVAGRQLLPGGVGDACV